MALKSIQRSATVAFAPMAQVMAVGTMAGAIDPSFSSSASLELLKLDFASSDLDMPVLSWCGVPERFNRLSWSDVGVGSKEEFPYGVIAGGLADGSLHFWNPHKLLSEDAVDHEAATLYKNPQAHRGSIRGLEFSTLSPNFLASGGEDGDLLVWDLTNPSAASTFPPLKGGVQGEISYVSWNRKVQHIVASTSYSGTSVIWDLRQAKPVLSFTDPTSRRRCSTLQWNPEVATQLIVASDDDRSPSLQVWDLRKSVSPTKELVGHTQGVLAMAWCPCDSSLLLSCSKDNRTLCWDTGSGEVLCELPASSNWNFDVQWSPCTPGVLSTSSYDGVIGIYNIEACSRAPPAHDPFLGGAVGGNEYSTALRKAPKWLKRPVGASFGFGGTLVSFAPKKITPGAAAVGSELRIRHLVTEAALVKRSKEFEEAIAGGEKSSLRNFCETKAASAMSEEDAETWRFLKIMFDEEARKELLAHFGFPGQVTDEDKTEELQAGNLVNQELANLGLGETSPVEELKAAPMVSLDDYVLESTDDGEDFFDKLQIPQTPTESINVTEDAVAETEAVVTEDASADAEGQNGGENETDEAIERAVVVGNFKGAVDFCLAADRLADALFLAAAGGTALWEKTQQKFLQRTKRHYLKTVGAVVNNDLQGLVESRPLKDWKETLALICTFARSEDWTTLCDALGARLDAGHNVRAAILCYICAGNIERTVDIWSRTLKSNKGGPEFVDVLQDVMEKSVVLGLAAGTKQVSNSLARLVSYYAELLASQGLLSTALEYIKLVPSNDTSPELVALSERISQSGQVPSMNSNLPSYPEPGTYQTEQKAPVAPEAIQSYNSSFQQQPYYRQGTYQQEVMRSPSYGSNLPPVQSIDTLFPNQPPPSVNYGLSGQSLKELVNYSASPSSFQGPTGQLPYSSISSQQPNFMVPSSTPGYSYTITQQARAPGPVANLQPGVMMPGPTVSSMPAVPPSQGFMPVSTPSHQPVVAQEPQSPHAASSNASPPVSAPAATVQTADTSNVAAELKPVVSILTRLFNETSEYLGDLGRPRQGDGRLRIIQGSWGHCL